RAGIRAADCEAADGAGTRQERAGGKEPAQRQRRRDQRFLLEVAHMKLRLSLGTAANPRTWPILEGTVKPEGIELVANVVDVAELCWRQLKFGDFDVSEMSMSTLMMMKAQGNTDWVGLPVFTTRRFFHTQAWVRKAARIETPADLKGKRVGVPEYQQTAAL